MARKTLKQIRTQATNMDYASELNEKLFPLMGYRLSVSKALAYRDAGYSPAEAVEAIDNEMSDSRGWSC